MRICVFRIGGCSEYPWNTFVYRWNLTTNTKPPISNHPDKARRAHTYCMPSSKTMKSWLRKDDWKIMPRSVFRKHHQNHRPVSLVFNQIPSIAPVVSSNIYHQSRDCSSHLMVEYKDNSGKTATTQKIWSENFHDSVRATSVICSCFRPIGPTTLRFGSLLNSANSNYMAAKIATAKRGLKFLSDGFLGIFIYQTFFTFFRMTVKEVCDRGDEFLVRLLYNLPQHCR